MRQICCFTAIVVLGLACGDDSTGGSSGGGGSTGGAGGSGDGGSAAGGDGSGAAGGSMPKEIGDACGLASECSSAFCVDGVCCESACEESCNACSLSLNGVGDGTCAPASAGLDPHSDCDEASCRTGACDGLGACEAAPDTTICRPSAGDCDVSELCDGGECPADSVVQAGTVCRVSAGVCDEVESCDGLAPQCPVDAFLDSTTLCRDVAGGCDVAENCSGNAAACPVDTTQPAGATCGAYLCEGNTTSCPTTCASEADCASNAFCATNGMCVIGKVAFTTSTTTTGNIGGLAGADAMCQARAQAVGRTGTFKAWLSDSQTSAAARLTHSTEPYYFVTGALLALDWTDLTDGTIASPFRITEAGVTVPGNLPFTSTAPNGDPQGPEFCGNWTSTVGSVWTGQSDQQGTGWTFAQNNSGNCAILHRLYCLEQ